MTAGPGDATVAAPAPGGLARRGLLVMAVGAATAVAVPSGAQAAGSLLAGPTALPVGSSRPDVVGDWFEQVVTAAVRFNPPGFPPGVADRMWAISWMSALAALHAGTARPGTAGQRSDFGDAAVARAVHDALAALVPDQRPTLAAALSESLAAIPDGDAKRAGVRAGQDAAARTVTERDGDGLDPASLSVPFTLPPEAPGVFRLPPGATTTQGAGQGRARPFLLDRADRFRPAAPPPLGTKEYRRDLWELYRLGGVVAARTERQSDIAWLAPQMQYLPALRALIGQPGRSLAWKVRLLAAYTTATLDAAIAISEAKFAYLHWRPVTAIRAADTDGDPRTRPDPDWSSYLPTPPNPEYPSGHGGAAGAAEQVLEHFTGPRTPVPFTATYTRGDGKAVNLAYRLGTPWSTLTQDNVDARVWAGVHFRFSDEAGAALGRRVADYNLRRLARRHADR